MRNDKVISSRVEDKFNNKLNYQIKGKISFSFWLGCLVLCGLSFLIQGMSVAKIWAEDSCLTSYYQKSLHFSGAGMRYWYEGKNGFMSLSKISYAQAGCPQCHARSCDQCHGIKDKTGKVGFSTNEARKNDTCLGCHEKEKRVIEMSQGDEKKDVHAKMSCISCHKDPDIHGDGVAKQSLYDNGAITPSCESCHVGTKTKGPRFDPEIRPHKRHKKSTELHCNACHVRWSLTCYNCHFSEFMKTKSRAGNFIPTSDLFMLVNYRGKVTAGVAMVIVHGQKTYVSYAPFFTHNVMKKGRACEDCHGNAGMLLLKEGKKIPAATFENGQVRFWSGVVPVAQDTLTWQFFDKQQGKWVPLGKDKPDIERYSGYAEPLSEKQIKILKVHFGSGKGDKGQVKE
ncbi:MAG: cytochrome c3 family protein [bacterium]|nr:cytochrome c3 family protein [bacterium]